MNTMRDEEMRKKKDEYWPYIYLLVIDHSRFPRDLVKTFSWEHEKRKSYGHKLCSMVRGVATFVLEDQMKKKKSQGRGILPIWMGRFKSMHQYVSGDLTEKPCSQV